MNNEARVTKSIKMKPRIVHKTHLKAIEQGKTPSRWIEDALEENVNEKEKRAK